MIGTRWCRPDYDPADGEYNGYTVIGISNTEHEHPNHPKQVIYEGDNGHMWSLQLDKWPGNLIPEVIVDVIDDVFVDEIVKVMIEKYKFKVNVENMELDMGKFSNALLDSMEDLWKVESMVYAKLMSLGMEKNVDDDF
jgi:hypothetical protein